MKRQLAKAWSEALLGYRNREGLNQEQLGALLGVSQTTIARWEREDALPSAASRTRLAGLLFRQNCRSMSSSLLAYVANTSGRVMILDPQMKIVSVSKEIQDDRTPGRPPLLGLDITETIRECIGQDPEILNPDKGPLESVAMIVGTVMMHDSEGTHVRKFLAEPLAFPEGLGLLVETKVIDPVGFDVSTLGVKSLTIREIQEGFPVL